jgi:DNA-binding transcriptional regulator GbsR (MarR family)
MDRAAEEFVEQMGIYAQADGLPRIAGRMFGFFIVECGPHSFSELADKLRVSRGSVSTNVRILESFGAIERTSRPGDRQDYFRLTDDPYARMLEGSLMRIQRVERLAEKTLGELPETSRDSRSRLREMLTFYALARRNTQDVMTSWNKRKRKSA